MIDVRSEAERFAATLSLAARLLTLQQERAKAYARQYGVIMYVYRTPTGLDMGTQRPQVSDAWRVAPSGSVTYIGSGSI